MMTVRSDDGGGAIFSPRAIFRPVTTLAIRESEPAGVSSYKSGLTPGLQLKILSRGSQSSAIHGTRIASFRKNRPQGTHKIAKPRIASLIVQSRVTKYWRDLGWDVRVLSANPGFITTKYLKYVLYSYEYSFTLSALIRKLLGHIREIFGNQ